MEDFSKLDPELLKALKDLLFFIEEISGIKASQKDLALALKPYFVKKEICDFFILEQEKFKN